jgi:hypothetical protein
MAVKKPHMLHNVSALSLPNFGSSISQEAANEQQKEVLFAQKRDFWLYGEKTTEPITDLQREHEEYIQYDDYTDSLCVSLLTYMKETLEPWHCKQCMKHSTTTKKQGQASMRMLANFPNWGCFFHRRNSTFVQRD